MKIYGYLIIEMDAINLVSRRIEMDVLGLGKNGDEVYAMA